MKNVLVNYISQAWVALMGVAFIPFYIRFLGEEAYGLIGFFTVISIFLHTISMGIVPILTREMTQIFNRKTLVQEILDLKYSIEIIAIIIALVIMGMFFLLSEGIANGWLKSNSINSDTVKSAVQIMGVIISIRLLESVYRSVLIGLGKISIFATITAVMATIRGTGALLVLYQSQGSVLAFFTWNLVTTIITIVIQKNIVTRSLKKIRLTGRFRMSAILRVKNFALGMMLVSISGSFYNQTDKFILSGLLPLSEYGSYVIASTLAATVFMAVSPLTQAIFPELSKLYFEKKHHDFTQLYIWSARLVVILTSVIGLSLAFNAKNILEIWTGNSTISHELVTVFILLCMSSVINGFSWVSQQAHFSIGNSTETVKINTISAIFLVIFIIPIVSAFGMIGSAFLLLVINIFYSILFLIISRRDFIQNGFWKFMLLDLVSPILICFVCLALWRELFFIIAQDVHVIIKVVIPAITTMLFLLITYRYITKQHLSRFRVL